MTMRDTKPKRHLGLILLTLGVVLTSAMSLHANNGPETVAVDDIFLAAEAKDIFLAGSVWLSLIAGMNFLMAFILGLSQRIEDEAE